jgi:hypothetical protein
MALYLVLPSRLSSGNYTVKSQETASRLHPIPELGAVPAEFSSILECRQYTADETAFPLLRVARAWVIGNSPDQLNP